jgi:hypothetical protein
MRRNAQAPKLPEALAKACSQLAHERTRAATWRLSEELKQECARRIKAGELPETLHAGLVEQLRQAVIEQLQSRRQP